MNETTRRLQREAERIASKHPVPEFYTRFKAPHSVAKKLFFNHPGVLRLRKIAEPQYNEALGHGLYHCTRVSIDSAALLFIETDSERMKPVAVERLMVLGIFAGLLHDVCRGDDNHAECGAVEAEKILQDFHHLSKNEVACICNAIRNHEAFVPPASVESPRHWMQLVSDCLYDADKFRWGADTFTHTLWHIADHQGLDPRELIRRFPWGMTGTYRIIETFRTPTGRQYGPEIIETGVEIGKEIYRYLLHHYRDEP
ncbi:MAG: hypothetical protein WAW37_07655 [Syntrophobacteraceae bacterium]